MAYWILLKLFHLIWFVFDWRSFISKNIASNWKWNSNKKWRDIIQWVHFHANKSIQFDVHVKKKKKMLIALHSLYVQNTSSSKRKSGKCLWYFFFYSYSIMQPILINYRNIIILHILSHSFFLSMNIIGEYKSLQITNKTFFFQIYYFELNDMPFSMNRKSMKQKKGKKI